MTGMVANAVNDILAAVRTTPKHNEVALTSSQLRMPEIEIPGTKFGIKAMVGLLRRPFGRDYARVEGQISEPRADTPTAQVEVTVQIFQNATRKGRTVRAPLAEPRAVAQRTAEAVLQEIYPDFLFQYLVETQNGRLDEALSLVHEMIRKGDKASVGQAYVLWGHTLLHKGLVEEALARFEQASRLFPEHPGAYTEWARALEEQGRYEDAIDKYLTAIRLLTPHKRFANVIKTQLARTFTHAGNYTEATRVLREVLGSEPGNSRACLAWGDMLVSQGRLHQSIEWYERAARLDPQEVITYNQWGLALQALGRYPAAIDVFEQALARDADNWAVHNNWGGVLLDLGRVDQAIDRFRQAIRLDPLAPQPHVSLARALERQKHYEKAVHEYQQALSLAPDYGEVHADMGNLLRRLGRYSEAARFLDRGVQLLPDDPKVRSYRGLLLQAQSRYIPAIEEYQEALKRNPDSYTMTFVYCNMGLSYAYSGRYDAAVERFQRALEVNPRCAGAYLDWAIVLELQGRAEEAKAKLAYALQLDPNVKDQLSFRGRP